MSKYPHIEYVSLDNSGALKECAILKKAPDGNIFLIPLDYLDSVDKARIKRMVLSPNAHRMELWEIMSQTTLQNGINALTYFHQLVRQKVGDTGIVIRPTTNKYISPHTVKAAKAAIKEEEQILGKLSGNAVEVAATVPEKAQGVVSEKIVETPDDPLEISFPPINMGEKPKKTTK